MERKRRCIAKNKAGGPCSAPPLVGKEHCLAHDPTLSDSERFGSRAQAKEAAKLAGRPPKPRVVDVLRERFEAEADEWLGELKAALGATMPHMIGTGRDAHIVEVPDHRTRLKAIEIAFDRVYGKPKQATELSGPQGGPVEVQALPDAPEWHGQVAEVLAQVGAVKPPALLNGNGNGNGHRPD